MTKICNKHLIDLINKPIITDKTTKILENNQYCFSISRNANKSEIKQAIEYIFNVKVNKVNTLNLPIRKKIVGKFVGQKARYKKAIVTLSEKDSINLFPDN
uniref:Large ribosomal subunit protein uL23c n=1 Tax=Lympha mucosa TaxID=2045360 RepID=A0A6B9VRQ7_9FLOR|nr:ribosomal protein L23 [Lympha mucosa]